MKKLIIDIGRFTCGALTLGAWFLAAASAIHASVVEQISLDTSPLIGHAAGPFSLDFQLNGSNGNTATLSGFSFGAGGGASGNPIHIGGASGDLSSTVTLAETGFLNDLTQGFIPGNRLSFDLTLSTQTRAKSFPDEFTFAVLDRTGAELPTKSFFDVFVDISVTDNPNIQSFGADPNRTPAGGGPPLSIGPPTLQQPGSPAPEPRTLILIFGGGLTILIANAVRRSIT